jgi:hypothetical protein
MAKGDRLSRLDMVEMAATIYNQMIEGKTEVEIMEDLRIDAETFGEIRKFMLEGYATRYRSSSREHAFVEYVIEQRAVLKDIQTHLEGAEKSKQLGAIVGGLRLKSDIIERIVTRGQEFGIFKKTAERRELVAGILHADMSNEELIKAIFSTSKRFTDMVKKFGEGSILALPDKPRHYGESAFMDTTAEDAPDDEDDLPPAREKTERRKKRVAGRSGKHTGHRDRRDRDSDSDE